MVFGAHCYIFTSCWTDASLPLIEHAKKLGVECLDIALGDEVIFDYSAVRREAERMDVELATSPGGIWPLQCDISSLNEQHQSAGLDWHKAQIDKAHQMGAITYGGCLYGHVGVVHKQRPDPEAFSRIAQHLATLATYGEARGVELAFEPMSHFRTHLVNTPAQAIQLLELTQHPNIRVQFDTYHMVTELTQFGAGLRSLGPHLWGIHACENNRGVPGRGIVPWDEVFETLRDMNFDGHVMLESYNSSIGDFAFKRGLFHNVCPDADAFVREGLRFLKAGFASS